MEVLALLHVIVMYIKMIAVTQINIISRVLQ